VPNPKVGLFAAILLGLVSSSAFAGEYISNTGWAQPCLLTGNSDASLAPACNTWCQNQYGSTYYGTAVAATRCDIIGIEDTQYLYCCVNKAATDIIYNCKCSDPNQLTIQDKSSDSVAGIAYTVKSVGEGDGEILTFTCSNSYCFCDSQYYGERKTLSASASGDCTKCPCLPDTYGQNTNTKLCGWTANGYYSLNDNTKTPSTTLANCKIGPASSSIPVAYRTYEDLVGTFVMDTYCPHSGVGVCEEITRVCSSTTADAAYTIGEPVIAQGSNCWCHVNDKYLFISTFGGQNAACSSGCLTACKSVVSSNPDVRATLGCDE